jgi:O-antigen/teichoic acid export membrane protein
MKIKKTLKVIFVDFLGLLIGILNGFLLPKFFSIDSFAYLRTFTLYASYAGMFHIGFSDGMYLLLGGQNISDVKKAKIKAYFHSMLKIVTTITLILMLFSLFIFEDVAFRYFVFYIIPFQIVLFFSLLYRATGEFDKYTTIRVAINILNLLSTLIVVIIIKSPFVYMMVQVIGYIILALIYGIKIIQSTNVKEKIDLKEMKKIIILGFTVMIANTVSNLFLTLDRWFVKIKFTVQDFAYYSFGVSMLNLFLVLIGSVTVIFYPYLAKSGGDERVVAKVKKYIILICSFVPAGYFILEIIINTYLESYIPSLNVIGILILCVPFITLTNVLYSNLYKACNRGKEYLFIALVMLVVAFILNAFVAYVLKNPIFFAYATLITLLIWYVYSSRDFKGLEISVNEGIHILIYIFSFNVIKEFPMNSIIKATVFMVVILLSEYSLFNRDFKNLVSMLSKRRKT